MRTYNLTPLLILLMFSLAMVSGCEVKPVSVTVIYSGNMDGELEPCGCSDEGNLGGIKRRTTVIDEQRKRFPDLVLMSSGGIIANEGANDRLKSSYIIKAFSVLNYDAIGIQWRDLAYGVEFANQEKLPWVATNWASDNFSNSKKITRTVDGVNVTMEFFTWLDPDSSPSKGMQGSHSNVYDDIGKLATLLKAAKKAGSITVLTSTLPFDLIKESMPLELVDILFERSAYEVYSEPRKVGNTLVLQPGSRGMRLGKLDLTINGGNTIADFKHEVISMPEKIPDAERMLAWYDEYNAKVKEDYLKRVEIRKQRESGESPFVGEEMCKNCHPTQHKIWQESQHAVAYEDLEAVGKSFDPECIQCHTVGFNQAGGFVDMSITAHLLAVQCENCHGAGREHANNGGAKPLPNKGWPIEKICGQCHTQPHSPSFKVETYWPKIQH